MLAGPAEIGPRRSGGPLSRAGRPAQRPGDAPPRLRVPRIRLCGRPRVARPFAVSLRPRSEIEAGMLMERAGPPAPRALLADRRGAVLQVRDRAGTMQVAASDIAGFDSMMTAFSDPHAAPEMTLMPRAHARLALLRHHRTDAAAPARQPHVRHSRTRLAMTARTSRRDPDHPRDRRRRSLRSRHRRCLFRGRAWRTTLPKAVRARHDAARPPAAPPGRGSCRTDPALPAARPRPC